MAQLFHIPAGLFTTAEPSPGAGGGDLPDAPLARIVHHLQEGLNG
jgi:hypothetical protein